MASRVLKILAMILVFAGFSLIFRMYVVPAAVVTERVKGVGPGDPIGGISASSKVSAAGALPLPPGAARSIPGKGGKVQYLGNRQDPAALAFIEKTAFPLNKVFPGSARVFLWEDARVCVVPTADARAGIILLGDKGGRGKGAAAGRSAKRSRWEGAGKIGLGESELYFRLRYGAPVSSFGNCLGYRGLIARFSKGRADAIWIFETPGLTAREGKNDKKVCEIPSKAPTDSSADASVVTVPEEDTPAEPLQKPGVTGSARPTIPQATQAPAAQSPRGPSISAPSAASASPGPAITPGASASPAITPSASPGTAYGRHDKETPRSAGRTVDDIASELEDFSLDDDSEPSTPKASPSRKSDRSSTPGTITGDEVRIRKGPGKKFEVLGHLNKGDKVVVHRARGEWRLITTSSGEKGWVHEDFVEVRK
jgi:hypothetical protein